jgi:hypothetical protein
MGGHPGALWPIAFASSPGGNRFLGALSGAKPDGLFFTADLGQRIFQQPFSWKALGLDVRGHSFAADELVDIATAISLLRRETVCFTSSTRGLTQLKS